MKRPSPLQAMKAAVAEFERRKVKYALIGGHAASLYRSRERFTRDVDFALFVEPIDQCRTVASEVLESIGLHPILGIIPGRFEVGRKEKLSFVTSEADEGGLTGVIDILLPEVPWIPKAVARAQSNKIDLGFARVPVITPEDLIIAKCYALSGSPDRFQDLDDIKEIFLGVAQIDLEYLVSSLEEHSLPIPAALKSSVPKALKKYCS